MKPVRTPLAIAAALAALLALTGCAPTVVYAGGDGIAFTGGGASPSAEVLQVAQAHCGRFGKRTRYDGSDAGFRLNFQCVE